jgi:FKBP-type peptidyl-prolyl cis-trans isomerase 2
MKDNRGEVYGTSEISVKGEKITLTAYPIIGSVITTIMGEGIITEANETHMMLDFNHKLAGETLIFDITLVNFISS